MIRKLLNHRKNKLVITIFAIVFIIMIAFVGLYPFKQVGVEMNIIGENLSSVGAVELSWKNLDEIVEITSRDVDSVKLQISSDKAKHGKSMTISIETDADSVNISGVNIYRNKLLIEKISATALLKYIETSANIDTIKVDNDVLVLQGLKVGAKCLFTEEFSNAIYKCSSSLFRERAIGCGVLLFGFFVVTGIVLVATYIRNRGKMKNLPNEPVQNAIIKGKLFIRFWKDMKEYYYFIIYSAKTDLKAEVANSYLNWVWWVLEPLCNMLVYYFVFGKMLGNTTQYFIVFIYSGLLMWNFFNRVVLYSIKLVRTNKEIVTKVYVPKFILLLSNMCLNGFKLVISWAILALIMIVCRVPIGWEILYVIPAYLIMMLFTFACGTIFLHFGVFIDDLAYAISILMNMLFFLSGVFYDVETTIGGMVGYILARCNPIAVLINAMRGALIYQQTPNLLLLLGCGVLSIILSIIGVRTIYKYENSYVKVV